jgi:hypothetical protein
LSSTDRIVSSHFVINKDKFPYYVVISIPLHLIPGGLRFNASLTHPNNSGAKNTFLKERLGPSSKHRFKQKDIDLKEEKASRVDKIYIQVLFIK